MGITVPKSSRPASSWSGISLSIGSGPTTMPNETAPPAHHRPLRIGIDNTAAARETAGIGRYARELIHAILRVDMDNNYVLMAGSAGLGEAWHRQKATLRELMPADRLSLRAIPLTDDWMARLWQRLRIPRPAEAVIGSVDLFYSPNFVLPPLLPSTPALLTIHDLSFMRYPETFPHPLRAYLEKVVPRSVTRANHILTDSDATRQDLIALLGVEAAKITTLHLGVSPDFTPIAAQNELDLLRQRYPIGDRPYILAVGTVQPRKNYIHLMEALDPIAERMPCDLVIVGRPAWLSEPIVEAVAQRPFVHMLGFLDDGDLPALYRQAALLAFPSLYEGFGLPPLEAMACGTAVVASSASSVPEAVGEAGQLVDPQDVGAWTQAIRSVMEDASLRDELIRKGLKHSARFTWERAARQWLSIVQNIMVNVD
ncbi:MAG: glycosyltransferase family 1 protein [Anaerolineales bacterium]|nr:MAG: glycosyltransferase family 1 protein [Anaerolineales bacterium]